MLPLRARVDRGAMAMCCIAMTNYTNTYACMQNHNDDTMKTNEGVLCIPESSSITKTSPSGCLVLYSGHFWGKVVPLGKEVVGVFYSHTQLGKEIMKVYIRMYISKYLTLVLCVGNNCLICIYK